MTGETTLSSVVFMKRRPRATNSMGARGATSCTVASRRDQMDGGRGEDVIDYSLSVQVPFPSSFQAHQLMTGRVGRIGRQLWKPSSDPGTTTPWSVTMTINYLFGWRGQDLLYGGEGEDELRGMTENDQIFGEGRR